MKLFRFGQPDHEKPVVLVDGRRLDVSEFGEDCNEPFFAATEWRACYLGLKKGCSLRVWRLLVRQITCSTACQFGVY
jgi:hypothetical protein